MKYFCKNSVRIHYKKLIQCSKGDIIDSENYYLRFYRKFYPKKSFENNFVELEIYRNEKINKLLNGF
jgi:hypothetical protein